MGSKVEDMSSSLSTRIKEVLGLNGDYFTNLEVKQPQKSPMRWFHHIHKLDFVIDKNIHIPGIMLKRAERERKAPVLLFIDDKGKWEGFKNGSYLAQCAGFSEKNPRENEPIVISIDVTGFGELSPEPSTYDLTWWNDIERILTYLSISARKPIMGLRVRDVIAVLNYLESHPNIDPERIMIAGSGIGAIVALHASILWGKASKVLCLDMLSHYGALTEAFPNSWKQSIIIPNILKFYDLPDLAHCLTNKKVFIINPLNEQKKPLHNVRAIELYKDSISKGAYVYSGLDDKNGEEIFINAVLDIN
jgi:hypothetical protein